MVTSSTEEAREWNVILNFFSAPQKVIAMVKDVKKVVDEGEIQEESLQKAATIVLNYESSDLAVLFEPEEMTCGLSFLMFIRSLFKYLKETKGKDYIQEAKEKSEIHSQSSNSSYETGKITEEAKEVISKIQYQQNKIAGQLREVRFRNLDESS